MFQQVREIMNWVGESLRNESSYNIMVVPDNGSEIKKAVIGVDHFKKFAYIAGGAALFLVTKKYVAHTLTTKKTAAPPAI